MATVYIHIAPRGTELNDRVTGEPTDERSAVGHMWYELDDGQGNRSSYGFAPIKDGDAHGPGMVYTNDSTHYSRTAYTRGIEITQEQYNKMDAFGKNPSSGGFDATTYGGLVNSCIDFTWKALEVGGLNPKGFEGYIYPTWNIYKVGEIPEPTIPKPTDEPTKDYPQPHECTPYDMDGDGIPDSIDRDPFTPYLDPNSDWPQWAKDLANKTYRVEYYDPLALDLNGDGAITTLAEANSAGALFDHDGDGIRTATGWIAPQDGILVRDINGNGIIDNGKELFGDNTILKNGQNLKNGQKAISGMAALADLDSNSDGIIDDKDEAFDSLKVWQDKNGDGSSTADELVSLATAGITSINVKDKQTINEKTSGGFIKDQATFTLPLLV